MRIFPPAPILMTVRFAFLVPEESEERDTPAEDDVEDRRSDAGFGALTTVGSGVELRAMTCDSSFRNLGWEGLLLSAEASGPDSVLARSGLPGDAMRRFFLVETHGGSTNLFSGVDCCGAEREGGGGVWGRGVSDGAESVWGGSVGWRGEGMAAGAGGRATTSSRSGDGRKDLRLVLTGAGVEEARPSSAQSCPGSGRRVFRRAESSKRRSYKSLLVDGVEVEARVWRIARAATAGVLVSLSLGSISISR